MASWKCFTMVRDSVLGLLGSESQDIEWMIILLGEVFVESRLLWSISLETWKPSFSGEYP